MTTMRGDPAISRREALAWFGAAGAAGALIACSNTSSRSAGTTTTAASTGATATAPACVLTPEMTEGPFHIDGEAVRGDITEGKSGAPLRLALTVVDASGCKPVPGAAVDVWHADAAGDYSGFGSTASNHTFLRGIQIADAAGRVEFKTLYPGWYQGRSVHIHVKVDVGGAAVHTGQLFFDEKVTDSVFGRPPYNGRSGRRTTNVQDSIYRDGGAQSTLQVTPEGGGYTGALTLGVRRA